MSEGDAILLRARRSARGKPWVVEHLDGRSEKVNPESGDDVRKAGRALGTDEAAIRAVIAEATQQEALVPAPMFQVTTHSGVDSSTHEHADPLQALDAACCSPHAFLRWGSLEQLAALDVDVAPGSRYSQADAVDAARRTGADRAWVTRSGGLRLIFGAEGPLTALDRALVGLLLGELPTSAAVAQIEVKRDTRRPAGPVHTASLPTSIVVGRAQGRGGVEAVGAEAVDIWLQEHGMQRGSRYDHSHCVIDPGPTRGTDPVAVLEDGVHCHRCHGVSASGFRSWALLVGRGTATLPPPHPLVHAAWNWVHLAHARLMLAEFMPAVLAAPARWVDAAWRALLRAVHSTEWEQDPDAAEEQLTKALSPSSAWVRGEDGLWWRAADLQPARVDRDALRQLAWCRKDPQRVAQAADTGPLDGFLPICVLQGVQLRPECRREDRIYLVRDAGERPPTLLRGQTIPREAWDAALSVLRQTYAEADGTYLLALLAAAACLEPGGMPIMLYAHGPTGSGKTHVPALAAGLLSGLTARAELDADRDEDWTRQIGTALSQGARFIVVDEAARVERAGTRLRRLLTLADPFHYRPLYSPPVSVPWRSVLVLTGRTIPDAWITQPELGRRAQAVHVQRETPPWPREPGLATWRHLSAENAQAADTLVSYALQFARERAFDWLACAQELGLPALNETDPEEAALNRDALRALYEHLCGRDGERRPARHARWPAATGWWDLHAPRAQEILGALMPSGDHAVWQLTAALNGERWAAVTGHAGAYVQVRERGGCWVARAVMRVRGPRGREMRGRELRGADLPPCL